MIRFSFFIIAGLASFLSLAVAQALPCYRVGSTSECLDRSECFWNSLINHCMDTIHGPNSHQCSYITDQEQCTYTLGCHWKQNVGRCLGSGLR